MMSELDNWVDRARKKQTHLKLTLVGLVMKPKSLAMRGSAEMPKFLVMRWSKKVPNFFSKARVYGNEGVIGNTEVSSYVRGFGDCKVYGNAIVCGAAKVF